MSNALRVLIVEDSVEDTFFIVRELQRGGWVVDFERVETPETMAQALQGRAWDLVISDYSMPCFGGGPALALFQQAGLDIPFIVVSGMLGQELGIQMVKRGAHDYLDKANLAELVPSVQRELEAARQRRNLRQQELSAAYLAALVQSCKDAIIGLNRELGIASLNQAAEKLFGRTAIETSGQSLAALWSGFDRLDVAGALAAVQAKEETGGRTLRLSRPDGTTVDLALTISPILDAAGGRIGVSIIARDVTDQKREEARRLSQIRDLHAALANAHVRRAA